jgi:sugar phosphate permease
LSDQERLGLGSKEFMLSEPAVVRENKAFAEHPPGYRLRRGRNWFFLGLLYAAYYLCRYNLGIVTPELSAEYKFNNRDIGYISTYRDAGYAVGQFINGLFADGLGGKQAMAVGAIGTIAMNIIFGVFSLSKLHAVSTVLLIFCIIRLADGYIQAFGSPGMVKINTSWFQRRERGRFAGIFGGMIQLGTVGIGKLGSFLLTGFTVPILMIAVPRLGWRSMFFVPPAILFVVLVLMWVNVKNHPEEAGFTISHDDDEHGTDMETKLPLAYVFKKIAGNWLAWVNAFAYFCTGFVRRAMEFWWVKYMFDVWGAGKTSREYAILVWALPLSAFLGSFGSGILSDTIFRGKRAPVAALLYTVETLCILLTIFVLGHSNMAGPLVACILLTVISLTCNSTHSIIGTAAAMDLGGRKMAGFASGVIDSFQYFGAMLAGWKLGGLIDNHGWNALFYALVPFSALGALLMTTIWLRTYGRDVHGS